MIVFESHGCRFMLSNHAEKALDQRLREKQKELGSIQKLLKKTLLEGFCINERPSNLKNLLRNNTEEARFIVAPTTDTVLVVARFITTYRFGFVRTVYSCSGSAWVADWMTKMPKKEKEKFRWTQVIATPDGKMDFEEIASLAKRERMIAGFSQPSPASTPEEGNTPRESNPETAQ